jgi:transcriptional regulator with XRE-family HTH domain
MSTATICTSLPQVKRNLCTVLPAVNYMLHQRQDAALLQDVGRKLRTARLARGLTVRELADLAGVNDSQLRGYETGASGKLPSVITLRRLAVPLKTTVAHLIGDEESQHLSPYDSKAEYRALVDKLEELSVSEKEAYAEVLRLFVAALGVEFSGADTPVHEQSRILAGEQNADHPKPPPYRATTMPAGQPPGKPNPTHADQDERRGKRKRRS